MKKVLIFGACLTLLSLVGCGGASEAPAVTELQAMDTVMSLTAYGDEADAALAQASDEIHRLDTLLSISSASGDIKPLNDYKHATLSKDTTTLLARAIQLQRDTGGLFDPTIAPIIDAWGFSSDHYCVPDDATLAARLPAVDATRICLSNNGDCSIPADMKVDLGGIAKGYTAERVIDIFKAHHIESALISLGGNIQALGSKPDGSPWMVGIQDPFAPENIIAKVQIHHRAVVTSGGYLRYFEQGGKRYHHIIDPRTGYPAESGLASVSIISKDGTLADALSTALFVMGETDAVRYWRDHANDFDAILVTDDHRVLITPNIVAAVTLTDGSKPEVIA